MTLFEQLEIFRFSRWMMTPTHLIFAKINPCSGANFCVISNLKFATRKMKGQLWLFEFAGKISFCLNWRYSLIAVHLLWSRDFRAIINDFRKKEVIKRN